MSTYKKSPPQWKTELQKAKTLQQFQNIAINCQEDVLYSSCRDRQLCEAYKKIVRQATEKWNQLQGGFKMPNL